MISAAQMFIADTLEANLDTILRIMTTQLKKVDLLAFSK